MRYHLESTLPIHAFQPLGGRHSPFKHGMTLEGGGGGGIVSAITDPISDVLGTSGGGGGILGGIEDIGQAVGGALADVDKAVGDTIPGGWGTVAAIAVPYLAPQAMMGSLAATLGSEAAAAAALSAGTSAVTGAVQGKELDDILKGAALSGATAYGLSSLGGSDVARDFDYVPEVARDFDYIPESVPLETAIQTSPEPAVPIEEFGPTDIELGRTEMSDIDPTRMEGVRSLVAESGVDPMSATGGRFDPFIGVNPTSNIYTDLPVGYEFMGPNGMEIVGPNGKTYLQKDLYNSLADLSNKPSIMDNSSFDGFSQNVKLDAKPYISDYDPRISEFQPPKDSVNIIDRSQPIPNPEMLETGYLDRMAELPGAAYDMAKSYVVNNPYKSAALGLGALSLATAGGQPQPQEQGYTPETDSRYTGGYGSSGGVASPYLLRNRVTAENIYDYENPYDRYGSVNRRYAKGGEVKHFAFGGISNALTRAFQPIEKAIVQPVGQALPFLKDVAPYAGILAAPFITNPAMAVGVGALSSGFGRPGTGFDMKRALMGGIAAYGASTLGAGIEAAGTEPTKPLVDTLAESYAVPGTEVPVSTAAPKGFFRDTDAMQRGVGNLLSSDSDAAMSRFGTKASIFKSGVPIVMGTSGMMAIDEANKMREEAELAAGPARQSQADMLARISKGKKRAEQAVRENPYMYAAGGLTGALGTVSTDGGPIAPPTNNPVVPVAMPQQQPGGNAGQGMRLNQREYEMANPDKPADLDYKSGSPTSTLPPGFTAPSGPAAAVLEDFYNPKTKQRVTVGSGGYTPAPDFYNVTGLPLNRYPTPTVKPPDAATGYRPPPIPQNQFLIERMLNNRNIYSQPPSRMQPRPMGGLSSLIQRPRFMPRRTFAMGGQVDDELGGDYSAMGMDQGNMQKGLFGMGYAAGGTPRFLSGGGDGMSDSIPATIEGTQEARLADGEFVIPADVVSHLGNGSSKAGAKQLYSMMDRVRKARTGNEKQGRQIKPNKMMPA